MALPTEFREILTKILHNAAKILDKHLQELILAQNALILDNEVFLVPPEIISDPRYLSLELNRKSSGFSKTILDLLSEWQFIRITKQIDDLKSPWESSYISANFSRKILDHILIDNAKKHRLLVLTAPFKISPNCVASLREDLEIELAEDLRMLFLSNNYPLDSEECPIEFYSDHFYNTINNDDIHQLQTILTNIPTLILHSSISDYKAYFHLIFWLPYSQFVVTYTLPVMPWEEACEILKASAKEERLALRIIRQIIISIQEFLAAFISDWYYLHLNPYYSPRLLQSINILTTQYFDADLLAPYIDILNRVQKQQQLINENLLNTFSNQQKNTSKKLIQRVKEWSLSSVLTTHSGCVHALAFNSDRSILLSGGSDSVVRLWHPSTGKVSLSLKGHTGDVFAVAVSDNDKFFASSGSDCKVLVWNLGKLQEPICFNEHSAYVSSLVFCPDNRLLASGSYDNSIHIWDLW
ncbi:WD40 repeat domain-containing protein [Pseudanabaena minima]|uniref:WD40 repeat domain-containing protein n=1 Tax=Pseudanabaena minima TaxID=890415 RepID=UPI003DA8B6E1